MHILLCVDALFILGTVKIFFEGAKRVYNRMKKREIVKTSTYILYGWEFGRKDVAGNIGMRQSLHQSSYCRLLCHIAQTGFVPVRHDLA